MSTSAATALYLGLVAWLFFMDNKYRPIASPALWISVIWWGIVGSRPISFWLTGQMATYDNPDQYLEGSPVDAGVYLVLLILGLFALARRPVRFGELWRDNTALFLFMTYCLVSVLWSDYPLVATKRWVKDCGNVVAMLLIATDKDPRAAVRAVLSRYMYLVVPTSVLLIKYYGDIGRYYDRWTWTPVFSGITTEKNALGAVTMLAGIFLVWDLFYGRHVRSATDQDAPSPYTNGQEPENQLPQLPAWGKVYFTAQLVMFGMIIWLRNMASSSTALVCLVLGSAMVLAFGSSTKVMRHIVSHLWLYTFLLSTTAWLLIVSTDILNAFFDLLDHDATMTGRTDLWADVIELSGNALFGAGYQSFWLGEVAHIMWEKYYFHPTQAHNGYIETYLNGGIIGLILLIAFLWAAAVRLRRYLIDRDGLSNLMFPLLVVSLFYNGSEAIFNRLSLVWLACLLACLDYRRHDPESSQAQFGNNQNGRTSFERRAA